MNTNKITDHNSIHKSYITDFEFLDLAETLSKKYNTQVAIYKLPFSDNIVCVRSHGYLTDWRRFTTCIDNQADARVSDHQKLATPPPPPLDIKKDVQETNDKIRKLLGDLAAKHNLSNYGSVNVRGNGYGVSVGIEY